MTDLDTSDPSLHIIVQPFNAWILQYPEAVVSPSDLFTRPEWDFVSVTKSPGETTFVLGASKQRESSSSEERVEALEAEIRAVQGGQAVVRERQGPWTVLKVNGPLDLSLTGILNRLTEPLRKAAVPIYALSTWNTDYVLVPEEKANEAFEALRTDGWTVVRGRA